MNVKLVYNLKDLGITSTLRPTWVQYNGKHGKRSEISRRWRVKRQRLTAKLARSGEKCCPPDTVLPYYERLQLKMECCLVIK